MDGSSEVSAKSAGLMELDDNALGDTVQWSPEGRFSADRRYAPAGIIRYQRAPRANSYRLIHIS